MSYLPSPDVVSFGGTAMLFFTLAVALYVLTLACLCFLSVFEQQPSYLVWLLGVVCMSLILAKVAHLFDVTPFGILA